MARMAKGLKIGKALRNAAKLPGYVSQSRGSGRSDLVPLAGESPLVILKLQVIGCSDVLGKDKNGFSDPYVVVSLLRTRFQTPVAKKTTNPVYSAKDATFEFPIFPSLADKLGALELVVWDKDMLMKKEYLGEAALPADEWFADGQALDFDDPSNKPISVGLVSTRAGTNVSGSVHVKLGFSRPPNASGPVDFTAILSDLVKRSRPSLVSSPPTEGIGTIRSHQSDPEFLEDDGGISSEEEVTDDEEEGPVTLPPTLQLDVETPLPSVTTDTSPSTPTVSSTTRTPVVTKSPMPGFKLFSHKSSSTVPVVSVVPQAAQEKENIMSPAPQPVVSKPTIDQRKSSSVLKKTKFRKSWNTKSSTFNLDAGNDIMGIVLLEVVKAVDLPRLSNMTRTGWDMDPFVVISFGKKVFRTRVIRHSLNPIWDEKLLFHVREYESAFKIQLSVLDWDKLSSNDHIADASFNLSELLADAPQPDPVTGLYSAVEQDHPMKEFNLPLTTGKDISWASKYKPVITFRAKFQSYNALRQQFWRQYLKQYDVDDTGKMSHLELTSMLDSLGSTLSRRTVDSFFTRNGKNPAEDELTFEQCIACLETELCRPNNEKRRLDVSDDSQSGTSVSATPLHQGDEPKEGMPLGELNFSGMPPAPVERDGDNANLAPVIVSSYQTEPMQQPLADAALGAAGDATGRRGTTDSKYTSSDSEEHSGGSGSEESFERVINVKNCPLCHRPRMNSKAEMDIVTHLAVCASSNWAKVDRIMVGNFVTASQAQRKWYTKVISKVSSGDYRLGANSANIIVQNRMTGQLEEEKMQVYVRLGIRLLYKGATGRMEGSRARHLLKSLSFKQGIKYDDPASARDIPTFIEFHNLDVNEILDPLDSFKSFNEFFYRKLKPSARPVESPNDPHRLVSGADCRIMTFATVNEATRLWIKGREFSVARLLGDAYKGQADRYMGGALAIFRLAPQDYHRFHAPIDGVIGPMTYITGEYYTVNPQAIRTTLDVYGENVRKIVPIDSPQFGRVMAVCVGAMMVGSIKTTVQEGEHVKRGQEFGYFAFGGSTIVLLFERTIPIEWDEDLLANGRASLETLVRVGMGIGRRRAAHRSPSPSIAPS